MNDSRCRCGGAGTGVGRTFAVMAGAALLFIATAGAGAQQPAAAPGADPGGGENDLALSYRYRFSEKYDVVEDANQPDVIVQYQVGAIETMRVEIEKANGAPDREEVKYRTIYTERPAKVGRQGEVVDAVRRYDSFRVASARPDHARYARFFKDLGVWYHLRPGSVPEFICTTKDRPIRQDEYNMMVEQTSFPRLMAVMPPPGRPVRLQDTWQVSRHGALALLGRLPDDGEIQLEGTLVAVRKAAQGTAHEAIVEIAGEIDEMQGLGTLDARVTFVFEPPPAPAAPAAGAPAGEDRGRKAGVLEARGYISKLQMGRRYSEPIDRSGRLQRISTRELILARRLIAGTGGGQVAPLSIPTPPPTADQANSWILYDDARGQYHLRYPQEFRAQPDPSGQLVLNRGAASNNPDLLFVDVLAKNDPRKTNPQAFVKSLHDEWTTRGLETIGRGQAGWLPEKDWAPRHRKIFHFEEAYKDPESNARLYLDAYQILTTRSEGFQLVGLTRRDDHIVFRNDIEKILVTFDPGPSEPVAAAAKPGAAATPGAAAMPGAAAKPGAAAANGSPAVNQPPAAAPSPDATRPAATPGPASPRPSRRIGPPPSPE